MGYTRIAHCTKWIFMYIESAQYRQFRMAWNPRSPIVEQTIIYYRRKVLSRVYNFTNLLSFVFFFLLVCLRRFVSQAVHVRLSTQNWVFRGFLKKLKMFSYKPISLSHSFCRDVHFPSKNFIQQLSIACRHYRAQATQRMGDEVSKYCSYQS